MEQHPSTLLAAFAELAPAGGERVLDITGQSPPIWLDHPDRPTGYTRLQGLHARDTLHREQRLLRRGWGFVIGHTQVGGARRTVRLPLASEPVRLHRGVSGYRVTRAGDLEMTPLIDDRALAGQLEELLLRGGPDWAETVGTQTWIRTAAEAAGLPVAEVVTGLRRPDLPDDGLVGVAAVALYEARDVYGPGLRDTLLTWSRRRGLADTALAAIYFGLLPDGPADHAPVLSPFPLNQTQTEVVRRARSERIVVASGAPGNGKSHAVMAAALEVVYRGGSVLVATQSPHAADVLGELLGRYPGPVPVLFGDTERRESLATELAAGMAAGTDTAVLSADMAAVARARAAVRELAAGVTASLELELAAAALERWQPLIPGLAADVPGAFAPEADVGRLAGRAASVESGWFRDWRLHRLRRRLGAADRVPLERMRAALDAAAAGQAAARLAATGGTDLGPAWQALAEAEAALAAAVGTAMRHRARSAARWTPAARHGAAALGAALRAGRNRRRELLARMDGRALVRALPLWIGTVTDTEDLLPPVAGLFDLVILDEASHIDQIRAAPVLARARRALVVGDPRQLRFVSFVADVDVAETLRRHRLPDRLDLRRVSAFDLAAGAAPVSWLDEHHRCTPHLIEFSARRFYGDRIAVATRHPGNECADAIDVLRVTGASVHDGVNSAEVAAVVGVVRDLAAAGAGGGAGGRGIGVVSPFRAQADALEAALVKEFPVEEIERLGLRVGTVHAFQGSEADVVVASLGLVDGDSPARARFVADPHLFNVMVTRARRRMVVVTSRTAGDGPAGLVGEYLAYAERGPAPATAREGGPPPSPWAEALAAELRQSGVPVRLAYPVGRWTVDVCAGEGSDAVGLICGVHPDGPEAHVRRQQFLTRAGWRLRDAFASRWAGDPVPAALALAADLAGR
jgi:AAA domain